MMVIAFSDEQQRNIEKIFADKAPANSKMRVGFKSTKQRPAFLIWREDYDDTGNLAYASVLFQID